MSRDAYIGGGSRSPRSASGRRLGELPQVDRSPSRSGVYSGGVVGGGGVGRRSARAGGGYSPERDLFLGGSSNSTAVAGNYYGVGGQGLGPAAHHSSHHQLQYSSIQHSGPAGVMSSPYYSARDLELSSPVMLEERGRSLSTGAASQHRSRSLSRPGMPGAGGPGMRYGGAATSLDRSSVGLLDHDREFLPIRDSRERRYLEEDLYNSSSVRSARQSPMMRGGGGMMEPPNYIGELQLQNGDLQRELGNLKKELELTNQKLGSSMHSIKTFWSPELKKERALRKEESTKYTLINEQLKLLSQENQDTEHNGDRISLSSDAEIDYPLIFEAKNRHSYIFSELPFALDKKDTIEPVYYDFTRRNLCSVQNKNYEKNKFSKISISTDNSERNITFNLRITPATEFYLKTYEIKEITISPSEPIYYKYDFSNIQNENAKVFLKVESDSDICMLVSIQNMSCPVHDLERNVRFTGFWQTMTQKSGINLERNEYPHGVFIVLVVLSDDENCLEKSKILNPQSRSKRVKISVVSSLVPNDFFEALMSVMVIFVIFCAFFCLYYLHHEKLKTDMKIQREEFLSRQIRDENIQIFESDQNGLISVDFNRSRSNTNTTIDTICESNRDNIPVLDSLTKQEPRILRARARLYLYYLITIAIFYTVPVIQLVSTYQNTLRITGNQDLCYYNFYCSHQFLYFFDFNHIFSNCGYIMLGMLFTFLTWTKQKQTRRNQVDIKHGIPQHFGMYYAMGGALITEGVLSACYHICPNQSNFQFDTSFMYIITALCMVKLYENRHPDINAQAPVTFGALAMTIVLALVGILDEIPYFQIIFTIIHTIATAYISMQVYHMGEWPAGFHPLQNGICIESGNKCRLILIGIGILSNVGVEVYNYLFYSGDFATFLLIVLMINLILYVIFYIFMKIYHGERICGKTYCFIVFSLGLWIIAYYFFLEKSTSWNLSPAQSRAHNKPCILFQFYDSHDIWHFMSAFAMFFSFMVLFTLDDELVDVARNKIAVF